MKLSYKLSLSFFLAACLVAITGYMGHQQLEAVEDKVDRIVEQVSPTLSHLQSIRYHTQSIIASASEMLMHAVMEEHHGEDEHERHFVHLQQKCRDQKDLLNAQLVLYEKSVRDYFPDELDTLEGVKLAVSDINELLDKLIAIRLESNNAHHDVVKLHTKLIQVSHNVSVIVESAVRQEQAELELYHSDVEGLLDNSIKNSTFAVLFSVLIVFSLVMFVSTSITRPILFLRDAFKDVGQHRLDSRVTISSKDEIGDLAEAFNEMVEQLSQTTFSRDYVENIFRSMGDALFVLDMEGRVMRVNQAASKLLQMSEDEIIGENIKSWIVELGENQEFFSSLTNQNNINGHEAHVRTNTGELLSIYLSSSQLHRDDGGVEGVILLAQDISARKQAEERLHFLANYDPLTGLSNRAMLFERLADAISRPISDRRKVALLICGLDRFKMINDTLGHKVGDQLLQNMAQRLQANVRSQDTVARIGGDEFAIVMPGVDDVDSVSKAAEKIVGNMSGSIELGDQEIFLTVSIGVSIYPVDGTDSLTLLKNADIALSYIKSRTKNAYGFYSDVSGVKTTDYLQLENDLQHAIERQELVVYYQPKVDIDRKKITGCEALIRWQHPAYGIVSPAEFLPMADETGFIVPMGEWILNTACRQAKSWVEAGFDDFKMSVNLSDQEFKRDDLLDVIKAALKTSGLSPKHLELEITENIVMHNPRSALAIMQNIRELGIELSIDDFGTGYSSLSHLKRFPINTVKIDRSFVMDVATDRDDMAIVEAIMAIARKMKLNVIAEGVENSDQRDFLRKNGCTVIQGFLYSPPVTSGQFSELLVNQEQLFA